MSFSLSHPFYAAHALYISSVHLRPPFPAHPPRVPRVHQETFPEEHDGDVVRVLPPCRLTLFSGEVNANGPVSRQALATTPV